MAIFHTKKGFFAAAAAGDAALVEEYLEIKGTDWCSLREKKTEETALHKAAASGSTATVKAVLKGARWKSAILAIDANGRTALHRAVSSGHREVVKTLLDDENAGNLVVAGYATAPVNLAILANNIEILKDLIATGKADLSADNPPALYYAIDKDKPDCVKFLLGLHINPNAPHVESECYQGRKDWVRVFKNNYDYKSPETPLFRAVRKNRPETVQALLAAGAVPAPDELPLHCAAQEGNLEIARLLLEAKVVHVKDINAADQTALHLAAQKNLPAMVSLLLAAGANPLATDAKGETPVSAAQKFALSDIIGLLRGAVPAQNKNVVPAQIKNSAPAQNDVQAPAQEKTALFTQQVAEAYSLIDKLAGVTPVAVAPAVGDEGNKISGENKISGGETWTLAGKIVLAHRLELPEIRRSMTEIFNFESRERLIITENLALKSEIMSPAESFDNIAEESLTRAFGEFRRLGGVLDETAVFRNRRVKITAKPA